MGVAVLVPGVNWAGRNLGSVTPTESVAVQAIAIQGPDSVVNGGQFTAVLFPVFTNERGVTWSITSGSEYATIDSTGMVSARAGALSNSVTIRATSSTRPSVFAEKTIVVTSGQMDYYDYLQSDGNCRLLVDGLTELYSGKVIVRGTLVTGNGYLFGAAYGNAAVSTKLGMYKRNAGTIGVAFGNQNFVATNIQPQADKVYRVEYQLSSAQSANDAQFKIYDDETDSLLFTSVNGICYLNTDISIFCYGYSEGGVGTTYHPEQATFAAGKLYGLIVKDANDSILRDLRPVDMNGTPALFDAAQGVAYYNLGSGTLTLGND